MPSNQIKYPFKLPDDQLIDLFIIQWHTPILLEANTCKPIEEKLATTKLNSLKELGRWLKEFYDGTVPLRPIFILAPELSIPKKCFSVIEDIIKSLSRPVIFIGGVEYLSWNEYKEFIERSNMPDQSKWLEGGRPELFVNAAGIWIGNKSTDITKYLQPKTYPYVDENPVIYSNPNNYLIFTSEDDMSGARLNFTVQICSDFTANDRVQKFRKELLTGVFRGQLDITFLLQCNPNQEADQFTKAVEAYFLAPDRMIETDASCLIFINNANEVHGKTKQWGKSKFHFRQSHEFEYLYKNPQNTYFTTDRSTFNHQELVVRERGEGIYQVSYRPIYLTVGTHGSGGQLPFPNPPTFASLIDGSLPHAADEKKFHAIPAYIYWLINEWVEGGKEIDAYINPKINEAAISALKGLAPSFCKEWEDIIAGNNLSAKTIIKLFFIDFDNEEHYPFAQPEPEHWCADVSIATKKFMCLYALLACGMEGIEKISPAVSYDRHAKSDNYIATFFYGGKRKLVTAIITKFLYTLDTIECAIDTQKRIILMVDTMDSPSIEQIRSNLKSFVRADDVPVLLGQRPVLGDVVQAEGLDGLVDFRLVYSNALFTDLTQAKDQKNLLERLSKTLQECTK